MGCKYSAFPMGRCVNFTDKINEDLFHSVNHG
jgi:hypothetical protein